MTTLAKFNLRRISLKTSVLVVLLQLLFLWFEFDENVVQAYADMLFELGELKQKLDVSNLFYNP